MCCLKYEEDTYEELNKNLPREGDIIHTSAGDGEVLSVNILRQTVKAAVRKNPQDTPTVGVFVVDEIKIIKRRVIKDDEKIDRDDELKDILD